MKKIIENVINSKNYDLSDILKKIDTLWVQGSIDEEAKKHLAELARANANVQNSIDILAKLEELDKRVKALEDAQASTETEEPSETTYPEYTAGKWYYAGDKVTFDEKVHECTAPEGQVCTWSPAEYPSYWKEVEE